jgi:hypothetical protein
MTRTVWLALILVLTGIAAPARAQTAQPDAAATIVLLARHAEKASQPADDPPLTLDGRRRAEALAVAVKDAQPTAIITTCNGQPSPLVRRPQQVLAPSRPSKRAVPRSAGRERRCRM